MADQRDLPFDRKALESLLKRRLFFIESFEVYRTALDWKGDNGGLYDYGPPGTALQNNIVDLWRKHFVLEEDMLELDCSILTPEDVLKTSGHVDRFSDWMCKDPVKGQYLRADHLVQQNLSTRLRGDNVNTTTRAQYEDILAKLDNYDGQDLADVIERLNVRNPDGNNKVEPPVAFNLMFKSSIGPSSAAPVYLRPETAQSQFLNFRRLLEYNKNNMPFASACVGKSYRNEISPRSGLLRTREFLMAEIEHFVDPAGGKKHDRFWEVEDVELELLDRQTQTEGKSATMRMTVGDAVSRRIIDNETLGYFLARTHVFLIKLGIHADKLRFRQHLANEMAHYACDCWDAEILTSYGWIECVGCADRSAYDLEVHSKRSGEKLVVQERLPRPRKVTEWVAMLDKKKSGPLFRGMTSAVESTLAAMDQTTLEELSCELAAEGAIKLNVTTLTEKTVINVPGSVLIITQQTRTVHTREYTPNVIEPSLGIGRILYSLLEHVFWCRPDDPARTVLSLPIAVAPIKVAVLPLTSEASLDPFVKQISKSLKEMGIASHIDSSSATLGKRYARADELGTPLAVTVDAYTVSKRLITLRDRDSTDQVCDSIERILQTVRALVEGTEVWSDPWNTLLQIDRC